MIATITGHSPVTAAARDILKIMIMVTVTLRFAVPVMKTNITAAKGATVLSMTMTLTGTEIIPTVSPVMMIFATILSTNIPTSLTRYSTTARIVELEIDKGGKDDGNDEILYNIANSDEENLYIKSDSSLSDGMELVSHPCSLQYHKTEFPWADVMKKAVSMYYRSHNTNTCGLHIHIGREDLGENVEEQEEVISRIMFFFESHWNEMFNFSRRSEYAVEHWASRYGYKEKPKDILEDAKKNRKGRYACVNITNYDTIEIRLFRGTLKYNTFIAAIEMVDLICENAIRRLYVNEPVTNEEEI